MREKTEVHIRHLPESDPHNPGHVSHREQWLEIARAIGRALAERDYNRARGTHDENSGGIRQIFDRPTK